MKQLELLICVLAVTLLSAGVWAQEAEPEPTEPVTVTTVAAEPEPEDAAAIKAKIEALEKEEDDLKAKLYAARKKVEKSPEVADLRKEYSDASKTYQEAKIKDPTLIAAKKTSRAVSEAFKTLVLAKVKASDRGAAIAKEVSDLEEKRAALSLQAAVAELKLEHKDSPIARALDADPVVKEFKTAYYEAKRGPARDKARADYKDIVKTTLAKNPEAKALMDEIAAAKKGMEETENAIEAAEKKLDDICDAVEDSDDEDIVAAKARYAAARDAYDKAYRGGAVQAAREARETTRKALYDKVKQVMSQDTAIVALSHKIDLLDKEIDKLEDKERELRKKKSSE